MTYVQNDDLAFQLEKNDHTAIIIGGDKSATHLFIPRSINYDDQNYIITSIGPGAFKGYKKLKTITFAADSKINLFDTDSFNSSSLKTISIPDSVTKIESSTFCGCTSLRTINISQNSQLHSICGNVFNQAYVKRLFITPTLLNLEEGWCNNIPYLISIVVSPSNHRYLFYEQNYLLERPNVKSDTFDILRFAQRDIQNAVIPSFVKTIAPFTFSYCKRLQTIEFSKDSELRTIGSNTFRNSGLTEITIPSKVTSIESNCFFQCKKLKTVKFSENSELRKIGDSAFESSSIKEIEIPSNVREIGSSCFSNCSNIDSFTFKFKKNSKTCSIQSDFINSSNLEHIVVPSNVAIIGDSFLNGLYKLKTVEFLGTEVVLNTNFFKGSWSLVIMAFPNTDKVKLMSFNIKNISPICTIFFAPNTEFVQQVNDNN